MHTIEPHKDIMEINKTIAERNRKIFAQNNVFTINIIGATAPERQ